MVRFAALLLLVLSGLCSAFAATPAARDVDLTAPDGTKLKATYFPAAKPGPGVVLLHMCNTVRSSWAPVAKQLAAAGIHAITMDNRGFGESGGPRFQVGSVETVKQIRENWPGDFDSAYNYLVSQPGVDKARIGVGGGSCGVNNAVKLASRHPEVRSLVLLAGSTDRRGIEYLTHNAWLPIFTAAADDDEYDNDAPELMQWFGEVTGNARNRFVHFRDGKHGTEIFGPHPELPKQIVAWYVDTLVTSPADKNAKFTPKKTAASAFWQLANDPDGTARAVQVFRDARQRDPNAMPVPEQILNGLAYERLQAGKKDEAVELFELNAEAHPKSANAQDSLSDGYLAQGKNDLALAASRKCLELLAADKSADDAKKALREASEQKLAKLQGASEAK